MSTLERHLPTLMAVAVGLLLVNTLLLMVLVLREPGGGATGGGERATTAGRGSGTTGGGAATANAASGGTQASGGAAAGQGAVPGEGIHEAPDAPPVPANGQSPLEVYLNATVGPLATAAGEFGVDAGEVLPGDDELRAAVASGSADSEASQAVIAKLRTGYERFGMPFPEPNQNIPKPISTPEGDGDGGGQAAGQGTGMGAVPAEDQREIMRAFFAVTQERLELTVRDRGMDVELTYPTADQVEAAVASGDLDSPPSQEVIRLLQDGYGTVGMQFPELVLTP